MLNELQNFRVLIVEDNYVHKSEVMRMQLNRLESALKCRRINVLRAYSYNDAKPLAVNDMDLDCFLVASDMDSDRRASRRGSLVICFAAFAPDKAPPALCTGISAG